MKNKKIYGWRHEKLRPMIASRDLGIIFAGDKIKFSSCKVQAVAYLKKHKINISESSWTNYWHGRNNASSNFITRLCDDNISSELNKSVSIFNDKDLTYAVNRFLKTHEYLQSFCKAHKNHPEDFSKILKNTLEVVAPLNDKYSLDSALISPYKLKILEHNAPNLLRSYDAGKPLSFFPLLPIYFYIGHIDEGLQSDFIWDYLTSSLCFVIISLCQNHYWHINSSKLLPISEHYGWIIGNSLFSDSCFEDLYCAFTSFSDENLLEDYIDTVLSINKLALDKFESYFSYQDSFMKMITDMVITFNAININVGNNGYGYNTSYVEELFKEEFTDDTKVVKQEFRDLLDDDNSNLMMSKPW